MATNTIFRGLSKLAGYLLADGVVVPKVALVDGDGGAVSAGTTSSPTATQPVPATASANAITPVVASAASSLVVKASAGNLYGASMTAGATAGFLIAYNAAAAPAGGASLTAALILAAVPVAANGAASIGDFQIPDRFTTGIVLLFSTSTTTYTVPANVALHMRGKAA